MLILKKWNKYCIFEFILGIGMLRCRGLKRKQIARPTTSTSLADGKESAMSTSGGAGPSGSSSSLIRGMEEMEKLLNSSLSSSTIVEYKVIRRLIFYLVCSQCSKNKKGFLGLNNLS